MTKPVTLSLYYLIDNYEDFEVHCDNFDLDEAIEKNTKRCCKHAKRIKNKSVLA